MSYPPPASTDRDEQLARLLGELTEQARQGQAVDLEAVGSRHPELAAELRESVGRRPVCRGVRASFSTATAVALVGPGRRGPRGKHHDPRGAELRRLRAARRDRPGRHGRRLPAWQKSLHRVVALKMILRGEHATVADVARFQVEAQAAAHLEHPNIVPVYAAGDCEGQAYFCMRYVEGETLASLLRRGPLRPREAAEFLAPISRAVGFAHQRGILHRDLKPSNVLLDSQGQPHITDFGLAKRVAGAEGMPPGAGLTHSGSIVGTPAYMAPEQVTVSRGKPSPASDVYSLGVILYEMLTGRPPFQAPTPVDTLLLVLDQDPVRPGMLNPKVDPDLELICLKCIQKAPGAALRQRRRAGGRPGSLSARRATVGSADAVDRRRTVLQPRAARDASRRGAGELGHVVDVLTA